jgi:hypothetical protein
MQCKPIRCAGRMMPCPSFAWRCIKFAFVPVNEIAASLTSWYALHFPFHRGHLPAQGRDCARAMHVQPKRLVQRNAHHSEATAPATAPGGGFALAALFKKWDQQTTDFFGRPCLDGLQKAMRQHDRTVRPNFQPAFVLQVPI